MASPRTSAISWVYDPRGLVEHASSKRIAVATCTCDFRSLRSKKVLIGAETVVYVYDPQGQLIAEYVDGSLSREYVWLDGSPLAQFDAGESVTWFTADHLLTPRLGIDGSKVPVWQWDSYVFGESDAFLPTVNLRYPGQYFDEESGNHYNWYRY